MTELPVASRVRETLADDHVHAGWEHAYRSPANEAFYERLFARILRDAKAPPGTRWLDVGCGPAFHSMRLARRGYVVDAVDFSERILEVAGANVAASGLEGAIRLGREDLTELSLADHSQEHVLAWGVLMHIPDVERAVAELARVLAPGGTLVVSEANANGLDARMAGLVHRLRGTKSLPRAAAGVELWKETPAGSFLTRRADIGWLIREFRRHGLVLRRRQAGQLSELYARAPIGPARSAVHALNRAWVALDGPASIASANVLTFVRPAT